MLSKRIHRFLVAVVIVGLCGCSVAPQSTPQDSANLISQESSKVNKEAAAGSKSPIDLWTDVVKLCGTAATGIDKRAEKIGLWQTGIAMFGSVSGVVGAAWAAAANRAKSAVAFASGMSGVSNTAQGSIKTYLTDAPSQKEAANSFRDRVAALTKDFADAIKANKQDDALAIVIQLSTHCSLYAHAKASEQ